jgi:hypothetical protein
LTQYDDATKKQFMILRIITWMFMFVGPIAYLMVAQVMASKGLGARAGNELMLYLLLAVGLLSPLVMPLVTNSVIRQERAKKGPEATPAKIFQAVSIVRMSCVEAIYIYGFIAFQLTGKFVNMLYFYPIGIAWSLVYWPRRSRYEELLEKLNRP